jgi:hypothetical protein
MFQSPGTSEHHPVILEFDNEEEDEQESIGSSTTNKFLSELKEEVVLQSLLHKQIHDKNERVFQLQHQNGRRLLVVLPPGIQSVLAFEEEANRTNWVETMLNTDKRVEGMLTHLAKTKPKAYACHTFNNTDHHPCSSWWPQLHSHEADQVVLAECG